MESGSSFGFIVGDHVSIINFSGDDSSEFYEPLGIVVGFGTSDRSPSVLVHLDEPGWLESRRFFVTVLSVHPSNLALTSDV